MNWKRIFRGLMISLVTIVIGVAIGLWALLYFAQDQLIFYRQPAPDRPPLVANLAISEVRFATFDGLSLRGWLAKPASADAQRLPLVIYFGGNAEEASHMAALAGHFPGWSLLAVNYRGYGGNPGSPSERALYADALAAYDWAAGRPDVEPARIVVIGRSLGSGVAVYLAAERPLSGVVLVTPYDSLQAVAQRHYPYAPVSLLLRHRFDSIGRAPGISVPVLMLAARRDDVVPVAHAQALFSKWAGPKSWREFEQAGHNDIDADPEYWKAIASFLAQRI
jgi:uncharacterized protein